MFPPYEIDPYTEVLFRVRQGPYTLHSTVHTACIASFLTFNLVQEFVAFTQAIHSSDSPLPRSSSWRWCKAKLWRRQCSPMRLIQSGAPLQILYLHNMAASLVDPFPQSLSSFRKLAVVSYFPCLPTECTELSRGLSQSINEVYRRNVKGWVHALLWTFKLWFPSFSS